MMNGVPEVIVDKDFVIIDGQTVTRKSSISPSQWLDFWIDRTDTEEENKWPYLSPV